ncbi:hypothetical protein N7526_010559 [Penicillium atrosanguineum]|nr:hypothetical protein N7526_010559 [Penicillium atrosanguineum]
MRLASNLVAFAPLATISTICPVSAATAIPQYVYDYAPLVWLHSQDPYRPSDLQAQLDHTTPEVNWTAIKTVPSPLTLNNLDQLNNMGNTSVYLTSHGGIAATPEPAWFRGITPDSDGRTGNGTGCAIVVVDHGRGEVDAFYFYFYAYNKGDKVLGMEFGDHMGDWEHNMIRFSNSTPQSIWFSQHASGQAFTYGALEKQGIRPYSYSGNGTHANYAIAGDLLPGSADYPVSWLNFNGKWGDDKPPNEPSIFGEAKYVAGPNGPKFKTLNRTHTCPSTPCVVLPFKIWAEKEKEAENEREKEKKTTS